MPNTTAERLDIIAQRIVHAPRFAWRPGMLARDASGFWMRGKPSDGMWPDLFDPPTIGCLAAMVIESYSSHDELAMQRDSAGKWAAVASTDGKAVTINAESFAEMLALLLEAAL